jgi:hypothetical protein
MGVGLGRNRERGEGAGAGVCVGRVCVCVCARAAAPHRGAAWPPTARTPPLMRRAFVASRLSLCVYPPAVVWVVRSGRCWLRARCRCAALLVPASANFCTGYA